MDKRKERNKKKRNEKLKYLRTTALVSMAAVLLLLLIAIGFASSSSRQKAQLQKCRENLKKEQEAHKKTKAQLGEKETYIEQWGSVFEQLSQEADTALGTEQPVQAPANDSPYKDIHADMQVTEDDKKASVSQKKTIHLTFDDGPSTHTGEVLDALDVYGIKATFFVTYTENPELQKYYKEIVDRGHTIAIHTATHEYNTIYASVENYLEDFYKIYQMVYEQTGVRPTLFRYPGGSSSLRKREAGQAIVQEMKNRGFVYVDWNVSCGDGSNRATESSILQSITEGVAKYHTSIVLMHDTREPTVRILPEVLKQLSGLDAEFVRLDQGSRRIQFYDKIY